MRARGPEGARERIDVWIHIGLLYTALDDHPMAWDAYRRAIALSESEVRDHPGEQGSWSGLAMAHSHLGMDLWQQGRRAETSGHFLAADDAFRTAVGQGPETALHKWQYAWFLTLCPDARFRDTEKALELAHRVVELAPRHEADNPTFTGGFRPLLALGLAQYRAGQWDEARATVERSIQFRSGGDAYEWFVLAMALARQGERDEARRRFEEAVRWTRRNRYGDFELHFLRDEAAALLDLADSAGSGRPGDGDATDSKTPEQNNPDNPR
jgi:tetratricopeptide (TPR) repeat protein